MDKAVEARVAHMPNGVCRGVRAKGSERYLSRNTSKDGRRSGRLVAQAEGTVAVACSDSEPLYSRMQERFNTISHVLGVILGVFALGWLLKAVSLESPAKQDGGRRRLLRVACRALCDERDVSYASSREGQACIPRCRPLHDLLAHRRLLHTGLSDTALGFSDGAADSPDRVGPCCARYHSQCPVHACFTGQGVQHGQLSGHGMDGHVRAVSPAVERWCQLVGLVARRRRSLYGRYRVLCSW